MKKRQVNTTIQSRKMYVSGVHGVSMPHFNCLLIPPPPPPRLTIVNFHILQGLIAGILCCDFFVPVRYFSSRAFAVALPYVWTAMQPFYFKVTGEPGNEYTQVSCFCRPSKDCKEDFK